MNVFLIGVHYKNILRLVLDLTYDPTSLKHQNKHSTSTSQTTSKGFMQNNNKQTT